MEWWSEESLSRSVLLFTDWVSLDWGESDALTVHGLGEFDSQSA